MRHEELSTLIGRIYDCALDPGRWSPTIRHIADAVGIGMVMLHDLQRQESLRSFTCGLPPPAMRLYAWRYAARSPIAQFAATRQEGDVDTLATMVPDNAWEEAGDLPGMGPPLRPRRRDGDGGAAQRMSRCLAAGYRGAGDPAQGRRRAALGRAGAAAGRSAAGC